MFHTVSPPYVQRAEYVYHALIRSSIFVFVPFSTMRYARTMKGNPSRLIANCPLCQGAYSGKDLRMIGEQNGARLFHCACSHCGQAMIALMLETTEWVSSVGLVTDLEAEEARRIHGWPRITSDDCIFLHRILEEGSAELCQALLKLSAKGKT